MKFHPVLLKDASMIPYYLWANREVGEMRVWLNKKY